MRILVSGSRDWTNDRVIRSALDNLLATSQMAPSSMIVMHGACLTGADAIADQWANWRGMQIERFPADWQRLGRQAGYIRNRTMVRRRPNIVLAFQRPCVSETCRFHDLHGSHGTASTITLAQRAGIPTQIWREGL